MFCRRCRHDDRAGSRLERHGRLGQQPVDSGLQRWCGLRRKAVDPRDHLLRFAPLRKLFNEFQDFRVFCRRCRHDDRAGSRLERHGRLGQQPVDSGLQRWCGLRRKAVDA